MPSLLSKPLTSKPLRFKSLRSKYVMAASTGSDLLDTLCYPTPEPHHETLFEQVPANGLGLQNIEIPQLASQTAHPVAQTPPKKKISKTDEPLSEVLLPSPRDRALSRIHKIVKMDRAAVGNAAS
mgnify:CR=1 FL=1